MTRTLPSLVVAAHIHHPKVSQRPRNDENAGSALGHCLGTGVSKKRHGRSGPRTFKLQSGEFRAPDIRSRKLKSRARLPLSPIIEDDNDNASSSKLSNDALATTRSSSPEPPLATCSGAADASKSPVKLANDKVKKLKAKGNTLESRIQDLETLVNEFKGRVQDVSHEFEGLKAQIDHVSQEFEALEDDHMAALDSLDQERETATDYLWMLRNAETEILHLNQSLPPDSVPYTAGFSQAKTTKAIYASRFEPTGVNYQPNLAPSDAIGDAPQSSSRDYFPGRSDSPEANMLLQLRLSPSSQPSTPLIANRQGLFDLPNHCLYTVTTSSRSINIRYMSVGSPARATGSNGLKRSCSSLSSDNSCSACGAAFGAPHLLRNHQRSSCLETANEIDQLRKQTEELITSGVRANKRRRVSQEPSSSSLQVQVGENSYLSSGPSSSRHPPQSSTAAIESQANTPRQHTSLSSPRLSHSGGIGVASLGQTLFQSQGGQAPEVAHTSNDTVGSSTNASSAQSLPAASVSEARASSQQGPTIDKVPGTGAVPGSSGSGLVDEPSSSSSGVVFDPFRLGKKYDAKKSSARDPDGVISSSDLYDSPNHLEETPTESPEPSMSAEKVIPTVEDALSYGPFPNRSSFELGDWFYGQGTQKSLKDFQALVKVLTDPTFSLDDIKGTKWTSVFQDLGKNKDDIHPARSQWVDDSGWKTTDIEIEVPIHSRMEQGEGLEKRIAGTLHHRSIVSILEEKIRNADASRFFQFDGHELTWKPDESEGSQEFRVITELYNSDAFLQAQREVRTKSLPQDPTCALERVVVGAMLWSDATHMSTFSTSKLWPLYMLFGNESKHRRGKDASDFCYHVAYFDSLSDSFKDYITERTGGKVPPNLAAHLNREFFHAQWIVILDDELLKAIVEGIVIECSDGVKRRFFIRIFTYSADYPEKVLIATIKSRSDCPCVRCLVHKTDLHKMGTAEDLAFRKTNLRVDNATRQQEVARARNAIAGGLAVGGDSITRLLSHSGVPTNNAFSERLSSTGFDIFSALVNDVLHEFEIGVFKALLLHLIRVLDASAAGHAFVHELDKRFRSTPTFNQTIRRFSSNVSQLRRRAARDYEDILQCAIPAFHGFLPGPLGDLVTKLLYTNARWHALAKLRMQTEATIILLEDATSQLGDQYRAFIQAVDEVETLETQAEADKRLRTQKKKESRNPAATTKGRDKAAPATGNQPTQGRGKAATKAASQPTKGRGKATTKAASQPNKGRGKAATKAASQPTKGRGKVVTANSPVPGPPMPVPTLPLAPAPTTSTAIPPTATSQPSGPSKIRRVRLIVREPGSSTSQPTLPTPTIPPPAPEPPSAPSELLNAAGPSAAQAASSIPSSSTTPDPPHPAGNIDRPPSESLGGGSYGSKDAPASSGEGVEGVVPVDVSAEKKKNIRRPRKMNMSTIKFHVLGHYPATIRFFGPSDLYSTEWGESFHRSPKAWFKSTSKRYVRKELSMHERKRARLKKAKQRIQSQAHKAQDLAEQRSAARNPDIHHFIGKTTHSPVYLLQFSQGGSLSSDIACLSFVRNLKKHLFRRFLCDLAPGLDARDIEDLHEMYDWSKITLKDDRLYTHRIMRIKYTTYDARRDEDIIHLETDQCNVMLLNPAYTYGSSSHPFSYGKVIAIVHADVGYVGDIGRRGAEYAYRRIEFLWVRWYRVNPREFTLDEAELLPIDAPDSHAFINLSDVLRASHIVPNFSEGRRYPGGSGKSAVANDASDYKKYFVNRFVDRDMFMRYEWGLAVGHDYARSNAVEANAKVLATRTVTAIPSTVDSIATGQDMEDSSPTFRQPVTCEATEPDPLTGALQQNGHEGVEQDEDPDASDEERHEVDEEDYVTDPERDSEDERETEMFGERGGFW